MPMSSCNPPWQERHTKSTNILTTLTLIRFLAFLREIKLLLQSGARFPTSSSKSGLRTSVFPILTANRRALATVSCTFWRQRFENLGDPWGHHTCKNSGSHTSMVLPANSHASGFRTVTIVYCFHLPTAVGTSVVDMIRRLTRFIRP